MENLGFFVGLTSVCIPKKGEPLYKRKERGVRNVSGRSSIRYRPAGVFIRYPIWHSKMAAIT